MLAPIRSSKAGRRRLRKQVEDARAVERHQAELARIAAEAAARRSFREEMSQRERAELSRGRESVRAIEKDILPVLGEVALVDVKRAMLVDVLDGVVERGARVMANHLFGDLR